LDGLKGNDRTHSKRMRFEKVGGRSQPAREDCFRCNVKVHAGRALWLLKTISADFEEGPDS